MPLPRKTATTMHDIAIAQGVSHTTVSFVLRGREMGISESTRQAILKEAISLDYQTRSDQRINSQKTKVLFLVPQFQDIYGVDSYYGRLLAYLFSQEESSGVQMIVQASINRNIIRSLYKGICEDRVQAVIPINLGMEELETIVTLSPVPVIFFNLWADDICSRIGFDDIWIGEEGARQFHQAGHRKALLFTSSLYIDDRTKGFKKEWAKLGGKVDEINFDGKILFPEIAEKLLPILKGKFDFTAIYCTDDAIALPVMQVIFEAGLSVPADISIIGCNNHKYSQFSHPALSTFRMNEETHGKQLLTEIQPLVNGGKGTTTISNKADFIDRQSIRPLTPDP